MIPTTNKPARVTRNTARSIYDIITNTVVDTQCKSETIQTDLSDHFRVIFALQSNGDVAEKHNDI